MVLLFLFETLFCRVFHSANSVHCAIKIPCLKRPVACFLTRKYEFYLSAIHVEFAVNTATATAFILGTSFLPSIFI